MSPLRWDRFAWLVVGHVVTLVLGIACAAAIGGTVNPAPFVVLYGGGLLISVSAYWTGRKDGAR